MINKEKVIKDLQTSIEKLVKFSHLKADKKLNILNEFIWPTLVYPLQCAPLDRLTTSFLRDIDKILKSAIKEIVGLPSDSPDAMIYSHRKYRGLGVFKAQWKAYLQHINISVRLTKLNDRLLEECRDFSK